MIEHNIVNRLLEILYSEIDLSIEHSDEFMSDYIDKILLNNEEFQGLGVFEKINTKRIAINRLNGFDIISELLENSSITEIMINGHENIFIEQDGKITKLDYQLDSEEQLFEIIQKIMATTNRAVNETSPIVDTRLSDGSRVNIVLHPISINGSTITIRKFPNEVMSIEKLVEYKSFDNEVARFLKHIIKMKKNIFISGATSSGKTSLLNALARCIPKTERIITIEDSAEIQIDNVENYVALEVRTSNVEGKNQITMRDLIKTALRMRPDRILVGEVRGEETIEMLQAMNTGHDGSISTGHSNSAKDMLSRLETMVIMGVDIPINAVRKQIASAIDYVIHLGRDANGIRKLLEIYEVLDVVDGNIEMKLIFSYLEGNTEGLKSKMNE